MPARTLGIAFSPQLGGGIARRPACSVGPIHLSENRCSLGLSGRACRNSSLSDTGTKEGRRKAAIDIADGAGIGRRLAAITNGLVALHREYYGKGPTSAKTYLVDSTVICVLRGGFTVVERTLIDQERSDAVLEIRRQFQSVMEEEFRRIVEENLERRVTAYVSQVHTDPDFAVEIFAVEELDKELVAQHSVDVDPQPS